MTIEGIVFSPSIGKASNKVTAVFAGSVADEARWYLVECPKTSGLIDSTVDTITRLETNKSGGAVFTPDEPGRYVIEVVDIFTTNPLPKYSGEVVDMPSDDDESLWNETTRYVTGDRARANGFSYMAIAEGVNKEPTEPPTGTSASYWKTNRRDFSAASSYAVGDEIIYNDILYRCNTTISSPHVFDAGEWDIFGMRSEFWVYEERTRQVGDGLHTSTLKIRTYNDRVIDPEDDPKTVILTPAPSSKVAKIAVKDSDVLTVLEDIADTTSALRIALYGTISASGTPTSYTQVAAQFSTYHIAQASTWVVHLAADVTNVVSTWAGINSSLSAIMTQLNSMRTAFAAHAANTGGAYHDASSTPTIAAACTTWDTALALWESLRDVFFAHMSSTTYHGAVANPTAPADGASYSWVEVPRTIEELDARTATLTTLYRNHIAKATTSAGAHAAADTTNKLYGTITTQADLIRFANDWADALERHAFNLDSAWAAAGTPYHNPSGSSPKIDANCKIPYRAGDVATAFRLIERVRIAYEAHCLNTTVHGHAAAGKHVGTTMPLMGRLTRAWMLATDVTEPTLPENLNESGGQLLMSLGWG